MDLLWQLKELRTPFFDTLFGLITRFGEETTLIVVFCLLFWCVNKRMAYVTGISFFLSSLIVQGMKIVFQLARPWVVDPTFQPVGGAVYEATGYTFPSGHTQNAAALLGSIGAQVRNKPLKFLLFSIAILVAYSRMYLGVHFLSDVLVSLVVAFVVISIALKLVSDGPVSKKRELTNALFLGCVSILVLVIAFVQYQRGVTTTALVRDSVLAGASALGFAVGMYIERMYIQFSVQTKNIPLQALKFVIGIAGVLAAQEGLRILGSGLIADGIRYFCVVMWITVVYPLVIRRVFSHDARK